jgi:hypothetical protein
LKSFQPPVIATGVYSDLVNGYSLTLPDGWNAMETKDKSQPLNLIHSTGVEGKVIVEPLSEETTANAYIVNVLKVFSGQSKI